MKTFLTAIALTIAIPAYAQAPDPHAGHDTTKHSKADHKNMDCCEDKDADGSMKDCCEQAMKGGKKMACCENHDASSDAAHAMNH